MKFPNLINYLSLKKTHVFIISIIFFAIIIRLFFIGYTERTWEDGLTAVIHADNFWRGIGLTHFKNDGLPVQGFTSPIGVLVPLLGGGLFGVDGINFGNSLIFLKVTAALFVGISIYLMFRLASCLQSEKSFPLILIAATYLGFEHHQILWGTSGLETSFVIAALFYFFLAFATLSPLNMAISMATLLYARPDLILLDVAGLIYILIFSKKDVIKIISIAFFLYFPWFLFTYLYYGNPIPHTIFAKLYGYSSTLPSFSKFLDILVPLGPSFAGHGTGYWREWDKGFISVVVFTFFGLGLINIILNRVRVLYLPALYVLLYYVYYNFFVTAVFGWYLVPLSAITVFIASYGLIESIGDKRITTAVAIFYTLSILAILPSNFEAEFKIQHLIENPVRKEMGLYFKSLIKNSDIIGMEPVGYASYFSNKEIYDYPGLASKEVVNYLKDHKNSGLCNMIENFKPKYIALRHYECTNSKFISENYKIIKEFKADPSIGNIKGIEHNIDIHFNVLEKNS